MNKIKKRARDILDNYLETQNHRRTPERYAILDAVYDMGSHFSLDELGGKLEQQNFRVSRATLYNTMRLFMELRLIIRHRLQDGTKYEACYDDDNHCHQICTVCGKVTEMSLPVVVDAIMNTRLKRFRKDGFTLYIYGVCSSCQGKITRKRSKEMKDNSKLKKKSKK